MPPGPATAPAVDPTGAPDATPGAAVRPSPAIAVVTSDHGFVVTLGDAVPDAAIVVVASPQDLAVMLVERSCRALFVDLEAVGAAAATLVPHLARQFPDVPIVAVGTRDDEPLVAPLVTTGEVYRFLHRPVSLDRARTFATAALRRADDLERQRPPPEPEPVEPPPRAVEPPPPALRRIPERTADVSRRPHSTIRGRVFAATSLGIALAAFATWSSRPVPVVPPPESEFSPVVDPVGAATIAARDGALLAPANRNAADLFREALTRRPDDLEARVSLLNLSNAMLGEGERALVDGRLDEAANAAETVALVKPRDARVAALREQVARARAALVVGTRDPERDAGSDSRADDGSRRVAIPRPPGPNTDERAGFEELRSVEQPVGAAAGYGSDTTLAGR